MGEINNANETSEAPYHEEIIARSKHGAKRERERERAGRGRGQQSTYLHKSPYNKAHFR